LKPSDIFNADISNASGKNLSVYLTGSIISLPDNRIIVEGRSAELELPQGFKAITAHLINPTYSFKYDAGNVSTTGQLPYGNYRICLKVTSLPDNEEKGMECIEEEIAPL